MSTIEKQVPQKVKTYKKYSQDHGDAAQRRSYRKSEYYFGINEHTAKKKDDALLKSDLADTDYNSMSHSQLEAVADELLAEPAAEISDLIELAQKTLDDFQDEPHETSVSRLYEKHETLSQLRISLLDRVQDNESFGENSDALLSLVEEIAKELDLIEESVIDILNERTTFPTDVEYGVPSRHQIKVEMARRATLDHSPDDDYGDDSYHVPIRIKTRL